MPDETAGSGNAISCSLNGPDLGNDVRMAALTIVKGEGIVAFMEL